MPVNQTPIIGVPFPSLVNVTDVAQRPLMGALVDLVGSQDGSGSATGVAGTGSAGTVTVSLSPGALVGVAGTSGVGTPTIKIDYTTTGVAATAAIGSLVPEVDYTLTGLAATAGLGTVDVLTGTLVDVTGLEATAGLGTPVPEVDYTLTGLAATADIGTVTPSAPILVNITGQEADTAIGTPVVEIDKAVTGEAATAAIGTPTYAIVSSVQIFSGVEVVALFTAPLAISTGNITNANVTGQHATASVGTPHIEVDVTLAGQSATASVGTVVPLETRGGLTLVEVESDTILTTPHDLQVNLRWSDDRGASWSGSASRTFGATGEYLSSVQWRRLGMARDRIFELSWSAPIPTALTGAIVQFEDSAT